MFMDDFYSWDHGNNLITHKDVLWPQGQAQLLLFWDAIDCPWEEKKQEFGETLKIIRFWVNINQGTITLTDKSTADIVFKIQLFIDTPSHCPSLWSWQCLGGHLNWLFNILQDHPNYGVRFLEMTKWSNKSADIVIWMDASLKLGMAFVYAGNGFAYQIELNNTSIKIDIFFLKLLAILSAISHAAAFNHSPWHFLILTDSLDSVAVFNTLGAAEPFHNLVIRTVAGIILQTGIDLRVCHIVGKDNIKANMLSCLLFNKYKRKFPADCVCLFEPP
ncbi:hypothetical protein J132_00752 [Termitomyces sp. J132]|nr:hypothetical protein J132_00752 [Termitomyces sp. J132]